MGKITKIGITSLYAGGKGTVTNEFVQLGAFAIDFDIVARQIVQPGNTAYQKIIDQFGFSILNKNDTIDRKKLANIVFQDQKKLAKLNAITHPEIVSAAKKIMERENKSNPDTKFALNIPLLFEAKLEKWVDIVVVVNTSKEICIQRGMQRDNLTIQEIKSRIEKQIPLNEKIPLADYIIDNHGSLSDLQQQVTRIWEKINES